MQSLGILEAERRSGPVTVSEFLRAGAEGLRLELECGGKGLGRPIREAAMNRPGLAMTGFFRYFAFRRVQVLGHAEHAYLLSMQAGERRRRLEDFFRRGIPCVVVTRRRKPLPELRALGESAGVPVLRSPMVTGAFVNAATLLMEDLRAPAARVQGTMLDIVGIGVLLVGRPGIGKSETALTLLRRGCSLVSDDVTVLRRESAGAVTASAAETTLYHMELRGLGIVHVPSLFGVSSVRPRKQLDLVVFLVPAGARRIAPGPHESGRLDALGVSLPYVTIPVAPGRDLAGLVHVAALNHKLGLLGHDAAKELDARLIEAMRVRKAARD